VNLAALAGAAGLVRAPGSELHDAAWRAADLAYAQLELEIPSLRVSRYFNRQTTRKVENEQAVMEMTGTLARLAAELTPRGYEASLVVRGGLWRPSLVIRNPAVAVHTTEIIAESDWFWWPMAYRLCQVADAAGAARTIINVLCLGAERGD
jgi:hypothetical protein